MSKNKKNTSPLDSLKADSGLALEGTPDIPTTGRAFVVYHGRCGPEQTFTAEGPCVTILSGTEPLVMYPGLNILPASKWTAYAAHKPIAERIDDSQLTVTDEDLRGFSGPGKMREIVDASTNADAIEWLLARENSKPQRGTRNERRDNKLVAKLERNLARAIRMPSLDVSDIMATASSQAAIAPGMTA